MSAWKVVFIPRKRLVAGEQSVSLNENRKTVLIMLRMIDQSQYDEEALQ